jgi:hypothetical protein
VVHNGIEGSSRGKLGGVASGIGVVGTGGAGLLSRQCISDQESLNLSHQNTGILFSCLGRGVNTRNGWGRWGRSRYWMSYFSSTSFPEKWSMACCERWTVQPPPRAPGQQQQETVSLAGPRLSDCPKDGHRCQSSK